MAAAQVRKHPVANAVFQFAAARLITEPVEETNVARNVGDAEEDASGQVDRWFLPAGPAALRQPAMLRGGVVGDHAGDQEADRAERVGAPHEPVVVRVDTGCLQRPICLDVEKLRAGRTGSSPPTTPPGRHVANEAKPTIRPHPSAGVGDSAGPGVTKFEATWWPQPSPLMRIPCEHL